jgi:ribosomal protein S18 acetylase RimI-like enzyme
VPEDASTTAVEAEIRTLSEVDVELYRPLRLQALRDDPLSFGASYEDELKKPVEDIAKRLACSDEGFVLGAFVPELVGVTGFYRRVGLKARHKGTIWGMYVLPEFRGRGLGKKLMLAAIKRASQIDGVEALTLNVVTTNEAARSLYLALGFTTFGTDYGALKVDSHYFDEDLMWLKL